MNLNEYKDILTALSDTGYCFVDFHTARPEQKHIILRHDIDMDIAAALEMAELEHSLSIKSTYYVLLTSSLYNAFTAENVALLKQIGNLGHNVDLHFDASIYPGDSDTLDQEARKECARLEGLTGRTVNSISFHRPAQEFLNNPHKLADRIHSYQPRYFSEMGYCSDSRGEWRHGHPLDHEALKQGTALQLLTHPIWWVFEGSSPQEKLNRLVAGRHAEYKEQLALNCLSYTPD
ncbi:hypothetical protein [Kiloniella sp. b19]|uniref:hypothetical protein n=1 Tax=Kiloniella sp. GXU_MW_B19 TaxID=3141326 RepID=UPI0031D58B08